MAPHKERMTIAAQPSGRRAPLFRNFDARGGEEGLRHLPVYPHTESICQNVVVDGRSDVIVTRRQIHFNYEGEDEETGYICHSETVTHFLYPPYLDKSVFQSDERVGRRRNRNTAPSPQDFDSRTHLRALKVKHSAWQIHNHFPLITDSAASTPLLLLIRRTLYSRVIRPVSDAHTINAIRMGLHNANTGIFQSL